MRITSLRQSPRGSTSFIFIQRSELGSAQKRREKRRNKNKNTSQGRRAESADLFDLFDATSNTTAFPALMATTGQEAPSCSGEAKHLKIFDLLGDLDS